MITVCLHGPESTGKSTLARQLAHNFDTIALPEFGRIYCETFGNRCDLADLRAIREGHDLMVRQARRKRPRLLILDTDAVMTAIWADVLVGQRPDDLDRIDDPADLYLLCDIDVPFQADGIRYFPDQEARAQMLVKCREELERRGLRFVTIGGDRNQRLLSAIDVIKGTFPEAVSG